MAEPAGPKAFARRRQVKERHLPETLSIVVSIFGLIGLGYLSALTGLLPASAGDGLSAFVFTLAIPLLLFDTLATAEFQGVSPWRVWAAYFLPFAALWALGHLTIRRLFGRDARAGIVAGAASVYSNTVLLGIPIVQAAYGEEGMVFLIVIIAIHTPVMMLASILLNEWALAAGEGATGAGSRTETLQRLATLLFTNPIFLGIVIGGLWRLAGFGIPGVLAAIIEPLARSAGPLALFAAGMALMKFGMARQIAPAAVISALKLLVMPALVFLVAHAIGLPPLGIAVVTLTAACPTGVSVFLIASRIGTGQALASNVLLISTAAGVVSVSLWLIAVKATLG